MAKIPSFYFCFTVLFLANSSLGTFLLPDDVRLSTQQQHRTTENPQIPNHAAIDTSSVISTAPQRAWVRLNEKKCHIKNSFKIHFWGANGMF